MLGIMASCLSILVGIVPDLTFGQPHHIFASAAQAEDFNDTELRNYAAALMKIEPARQSALAEVSKANGGTLPNLVCSQPDTMEDLNADAKTIFINYCEECKKIAAERGLTIDKFNQITQAVRSTPELKQRVQNFMN
ncbi:MAG: hypothetical protein RLZZ135_2369 [Cyanobacteriota bacterium]|jgi:hypothetical protein